MSKTTFRTYDTLSARQSLKIEVQGEGWRGNAKNLIKKGIKSLWWGHKMNIQLSKDAG